MKKFLMILALLILPSCSDIKDDWNAVKAEVKNVFTVDNLDTVEEFYGTVLSGAIVYRGLCERKIINKSCWTAIANVQPYENKAYGSVLALRKFVRANPTADASTFIVAAKNTINTYKAAQVNNQMVQ